MKKIVAISLALLLLVSNIGFAVNTHFCGGKAVETTFSYGLGNPDCGMENMSKDCESLPLEQERVSSIPCCENQHQVLQTDDTTKTEPVSYEVNPVFFSAFIHVVVQPFISADKGQCRYTDYPPPLPEKDIHVLFQTFLI